MSESGCCALWKKADLSGKWLRFIPEDKFLAVFKCIGVKNLSFFSDEWLKLQLLDSKGTHFSSHTIFCSECTKLSESALENLLELSELGQHLCLLKEETLEDFKQSLHTVYARDHDVLDINCGEDAVDLVRSFLAEDLKLDLGDDDLGDIKVEVEIPSDEKASPDPSRAHYNNGTCSDDWGSSPFEKKQLYTEFEEPESKKPRLEKELLIQHGISNPIVVLQRLTPAQIAKFQPPNDRSSSCERLTHALDEQHGGRTRSRKICFVWYGKSGTKDTKEVQLSESENATNASEDDGGSAQYTGNAHVSGEGDSFVDLQRLTEERIQKLHRPIDRRSSYKLPRDASGENSVSGCTRSGKVYRKEKNKNRVKKAEGQLSESENANASVESEVSTPECTFLYCKKRFETVLQVKVHLQQDHGLVLSDSEPEDENLETGTSPTEQTRLRTKPVIGDDDQDTGTALICVYKNCPFRKRFAMKKHLKRHIRKYHKSSMSERCTVPGCYLNPCFRLYSEEDKQIHMNLAHGPDPHPWKCPYCNEHFKNGKEMQSHRETNHADLLKVVCHICGKRLASQQNLEVHMRTHTDEQRFSCEQCGKKFKNSITLKLHKRKEHQVDSGNQCERCGGFFTNTSRECCWAPTCKRKCMYCDERFRSLVKLNSHIVVAHEGMALAMPRREVTNQPLAQANRSVPIFCSVQGCDNRQLFVSKAALVLHVKDEHGMELTEADIDISIPLRQERALRTCHYADCTSKETFETDQDLHAHVLQYHENSTVKVYSCDTCTERFTYQRDLKEHMLTHSDKPIYKCKECPRMYGTSSGLYLHIQTKHKNKMYPCEHCGASFSTKVYMQLHVESKHGNQERAHECDICGRKFMLKTNLSKHKKRHGAQYKCDQCGKVVTSMASLRTHIEAHHSQNKFKYQCKICDKKFTNRRMLRGHVTKGHKAKAFGLPSALPAQIISVSTEND